MNKAEYVMPGVIQVTASGPMLEQDDEEWFRNLEKELRESVARANTCSSGYGADGHIQPSYVRHVS